MNKKIIILLLLISFLSLNSTTVFANEDPPGPGLFEFLFGGTIYYKQVGITLGVLYKTIAKLESNELWRPYNPQQPVKLYPGFTMEFDINSENGRKADNKLRTIIRHSDKKSRSMTEISSFEGQFGFVRYIIPEYNTGYNYVKIYTEGGEKKTQDQVAGFVYYVEPNSIETLQNTSGSGTFTTLPVNIETGTVNIYLYDDMSLTRPSERQAKVALYVNGKRLPERKGEFLTINRMHTFEGVPAGILELRMPKDESGWMIKSDTARWELKKNSELNINFVRDQGGMTR